eukprot:854303-Rhodomonas_salina.4
MRPHRSQAEVVVLLMQYDRRQHWKTPPSSCSMRRWSFSGRLCLVKWRNQCPLPSVRNDSVTVLRPPSDLRLSRPECTTPIHTLQLKSAMGTPLLSTGVNNHRTDG